MATKNNISVAIASDHAGFKLKQELIGIFSKTYDISDLGTDSEESVDYPDYAQNVVEYLENHPNALGIIICGSGVGVNIAANRFSHIRAVLCHDIEEAELARRHNNANVITIGARSISQEQAVKIVDKFLSTKFEGGRHEKRVNKLSERGKHVS